MSRRLAVDKCLKKQILPMSPGNWEHAEEGGEADVPRKRGESSRRCRDAGDHAAGAKPKRSYIKSGHCPCLKSVEEDFIRTFQANLFIDSYYPKLLEYFSEEYENSEKSLSSYSEILSKILNSDKLGFGDPLESESRKPFKTGRNAVVNDVKSEPLEDGLELFSDSRTKSSQRSTSQQSSRSRLTLDSKTYTLFSCASKSAFHRTVRDANQPKNGRSSKEQSSTAHGQQADTKENGTEISVVEWFGQLYKRIETLEDLLQETLDNSFPQEENGRSEKAKSRRKIKFRVPETSRVKTLGGGNLKLYQAPKATEEAREKENFDTDNELRKIKKRVKALEMKLNQTKISEIMYRDKPLAGYRLSSTTKSSLILADTGMAKECCCKFANSEEGDSTGQHCSDDFFPRGFSSSEKEVAQGKTTGKATREVDKSVSQVKKNFISKCKRIKAICDSVISSSRKSSEECNGVSYKIAKKSLDRVIRHHSQINADTRQKATVVYVRCQQENSLPPLANRRKKSCKERKDLCRKNSMTNFVMSRKEAVEAWAGGAYWDHGDHGAVAVDCEGRRREKRRSGQTEGDFRVEEIRTGRHCWPPLRRERPLSPPAYDHAYSNDCEPRKGKSWKKPRCPQNPIDILKRGGRIRIPVLFKEICKTSKSAEPVQNVSNISIRFVLVKEDSKHPLKKLIKKLSLGSSSQNKEQYVFAVSKCGCQREIEQLNSTYSVENLRSFTGG